MLIYPRSTPYTSNLCRSTICRSSLCRFILCRSSLCRSTHKLKVGISSTRKEIYVNLPRSTLLHQIYVDLCYVHLVYVSRSSLRMNWHPSYDECRVVVPTTNARPTTPVQSRLLGGPRDYRAASTQFATKTGRDHH